MKDWHKTSFKLSTTSGGLSCFFDIECDSCQGDICEYSIEFLPHFIRNYCKSCLVNKKAINNPLILRKKKICDGCDEQVNVICSFTVIRELNKSVICYCRDCIECLLLQIASLDGSLEPGFYKFMAYSKREAFLTKRQSIPKGIRHEVLRRDNYKCLECGATPDICPLEIDHIIPVSRGGSDEMSNLQTLCYTCNREKGNLVFRGGQT